MPNTKLKKCVAATEPGVRATSSIVTPSHDPNRVPNLRAPPTPTPTLQVVLLSELELYRVYDLAASLHHIMQTAHTPPCCLAFVTQGQGGALSLVLVGPPACQNTGRVKTTTARRLRSMWKCLHPQVLPLTDFVALTHAMLSSRRRRHRQQDEGVFAADPQRHVSAAAAASVSTHNHTRTTTRACGAGVDPRTGPAEYRATGTARELALE